MSTALLTLISLTQRNLRPHQSIFHIYQSLWTYKPTFHKQFTKSKDLPTHISQILYKLYGDINPIFTNTVISRGKSDWLLYTDSSSGHSDGSH